MTEKALMIIPRTLDEVRSLSELMAKSTLLPDALRSKPADVFVSILAGQELGLPPLASVRGVHVVQGKPILSGDTMVGIVLGSGLCEYFVCVAETDSSVTYETKRRGSPAPQRCTWTMDDAKRAELTGKDNWKKYPRAMLKARAKAVLARDVYPDVLAGCYDPDEIPNERPALTVVPEIIDADIVDRPALEPAPEAQASLVDAIIATESIDELRALAPKLNALPKGTEARKVAMDAYKRKTSYFEQPMPQEQTT